MMNQVFDDSTKAGTLGGTILTVLFNMHSSDLIKTAVLAAVGAVVSFSVTLVLKFLIKRFKK